jgi:Ca-activated chloride channel family protein
MKQSGIFAKSIIFSLFITCVLTIPGFVPGAESKQGSNIVFILDASGSMWGQINGKNKIVIAKEVMTDLVKNLPDDIQVGLVAYGHRKKNDCSDVETLIELGPLNKSNMIKVINSINPKGKTPITLSIQQVAAKLKTLKEACSIILVSDGLETCEGDPCQLTQKLKDAGIDFTMYVVGFDVNKEVTAQLECVAKAGGGQYIPASSAEKLKSALTDVIDKAVKKNLVVQAFDAKNKPLPAMVAVFDQNGKQVDSDGGKKISFQLPPGTYSITVKPDTLTESRTLKDVVVTDKEVTEKKVVFAKSKVTVTLKDGDGNPVKGYIRVVNQADEQYANEGDIIDKPLTLVVSPGEYHVLMKCSATGVNIKTESFTLEPGEEKKLTGVCANARIGVLVKDADGKPIIGYIRIVDVPNDVYAEEKDSKKEMTYIEVPPGKYKVDIECPGPDATRVRSDVFEIKQGEEVIREMTCQ